MCLGQGLGVSVQLKNLFRGFGIFSEIVRVTLFSGHSVHVYSVLSECLWKNTSHVSRAGFEPSKVLFVLCSPSLQQCHDRGRTVGMLEAGMAAQAIARQHNVHATTF